MATIKITGASGYLGNSISRALTRNGHRVSGIKRELLYGSSNDLKNEIRNTDIIINLAGVSILKRWNKKNKKAIYDSRIDTTKNLVKAIIDLPESEQPKKFISASAIGIYKPGEKHDETSTNFETGFLGKVVKDWESASKHLPSHIQKNIFRIGLVLGKKAKTITNLLLPFKLGLGGTIGNGKQAFPFIHEKDLVNGFVWAVEEYEESGVFNLVAPDKITNNEFTKAFVKKLNRPAFIPIPAFMIKLILGQASVLLLESPIVKPETLMQSGFKFEYPTIKAAFDEILT